uniref:Putative proactivator polypeptide n=1 Tax=Pseudodiaptomus poplesia TaxID=213370 RepID=A0A0U2V6U0_9MAXI|nr:putative proactivator polypeptide [Pseudodiaptomus poplesia]
MLRLFLLSCLFAAAVANNSDARNELTCEICVDIVTDIDNWITSDSTEDEIVHNVEQLCVTLGSLISGFEAICKAFIEAQLPNIIEGIVENNLNPLEVCTNIGVCP